MEGYRALPTDPAMYEVPGEHLRYLRQCEIDRDGLRVELRAVRLQLEGAVESISAALEKRRDAEPTDTPEGVQRVIGMDTMLAVLHEWGR